MFSCYYCKKASASPNLLINHVRTFSKLTVGFSGFRCGEQGCYRHYISSASFKKHLVRDHQSSLSVLPHPNNNPNLPSTSNKETYETANAMESLPTQRDENSLGHHAASLVSTLYANPIIPRKAVQVLVENLQLFHSKSQCIIERQFNDMVPPDQNNVHVNNAVKKIFSAFSDAFENLDSEHKRLKYFNEIGTYSEPLEVVVGQRNEAKKTAAGSLLLQVNCRMQVIPLKENLKLIFSSKNFMKDTLEYVDTVSGLNNEKN